ncbi:MAG: hypothetical protein AB1467_02595 [Candidatus Diapherotrites archaeon]
MKKMHRGISFGGTRHTITRRGKRTVAFKRGEFSISPSKSISNTITLADKKYYVLDFKGRPPIVMCRNGVKKEKVNDPKLKKKIIHLLKEKRLKRRLSKNR